MTTIVEFLEARFREDEHSATHSGNLPVPVKNYHQRTLDEVAAKRRIVRRYRDAPVNDVILLVEDVRDLASVYADHPDYDQAWRPCLEPAEIDLRSQNGVQAGKRTAGHASRPTRLGQPADSIASPTRCSPPRRLAVHAGGSTTARSAWSKAGVVLLAR